MFHHHNRIIDDEPDGRGHAAERHDVEAHVQDVEKQDRRGEARPARSECAMSVTFQFRRKMSRTNAARAIADQDGVAAWYVPRW